MKNRYIKLLNVNHLFLLKKLRIIQILIFFFLFSNTLLFSENFIVEKIKNEKDQELGYVYCSYSDSRGFLWFGTRNGLYRYDGKNLLSFKNNPFDSTSLSDNIIVSISEDKYGYIWSITSLSILNKLNPKTGKFIRYKLDKNDLLMYKIKRNLPISYYDVSIFNDSLSNLWLITNCILKQFDYEQNKFIKFDPKNSKIDSLLDHYIFLDYEISSDGYLYLITAMTTSYYEKEKPYYLLSINLRNNQYSITNICTSEFIRFNGKDSSDLYLISFGRKNKQFIYNTLSKEIKELKLNIDKQWELKGFKLLPYYYNNQLFIKVFHPKANINKALKSYSGIYYLKDSNFTYNKNNQITHYYFDKVIFLSQLGKSVNLFINDDLLWERTNEGVIKINTKTNKIFSSRNVSKDNKSLSNKYVRSIWVDNFNSIYIGTDNGLNLYDTMQQNWKRIYSTNHSFRKFKNIINVIYQDYDGKILLGTYKGILYYDIPTKTLKDYKVINHKANDDRQESIWSILRDKNRNLWIGTASALFKYNKENQLVDYYDTKNSSLSNNKIWSLYQDKRDNIWIGTDYGLNRYLPDKNDFEVYLPRENDKNSICGVMIWSITEDNSNNLWFGVYGGGISKYDYKHNNFNSLTSAQGLPNETIVSIIFDNDNNLWLGTSNGLIKYNQQKKTFSEYISNEEFQGNFYSFHSASKTLKGELIFGSSQGISLFNPQNLNFNTKIPKIVVSKLFIKDSLASILIEDNDTINLKWDFGYLTFHISSLDFTNPKLNQYAYKIEGVNDKWILLGNQNILTFSDLEPGNYIIKLESSNNNDVWNEEGIKVYLNIFPPFWKTNWFKITVYSTIILVIIFAFYYFNKQRKKQEATKRKIISLKLLAVQSQLNPHFIFNCLNSILNLILHRDNDKAIEYLNKFARLLRKVLENSREIMIPLDEAIKQMRIYLDLELLRFKNQFNYSISLDSNIDCNEILIPILLLQTYIENSIKHGRIYDISNGYVNISFRKENDKLYCHIIDNGIGRNRSEKINQLINEKYKSLGTELTEEIISLMNAKVIIIDLFDTENTPIGTKVEIIINLKGNHYEH